MTQPRSTGLSKQRRDRILFVFGLGGITVQAVALYGWQRPIDLALLVVFATAAGIPGAIGLAGLARQQIPGGDTSTPGSSSPPSPSPTPSPSTSPGGDPA